MKVSLPETDARKPVAGLRGLYDSFMNLDGVLSLRADSAVGMTVFATVSLFALFACPGRRALRLTIEWE